MRNHMRDGSRLWDYQVLEELGKGEYGQVFKVKNKKDGQFYALKRVNISSCHEKQKIQAFREVKALKLIKHPDIIEYYESFLSVDNIYIVMEYAAKGDFAKIIKERRLKQKLFSEQQLWQIFTTLTNGVKYLHQKGIVHRDLKLENIFMTESGKVKLGDLGMCKVMNQNDQLISTRVGTPIYFAPEIIQHQLYSYPVDIWALGCCLYYLATLQHPFKEASIETLALYVIQRDPRPIKGHYGGYLINFISTLLTKSPKQRPDIHQVIQTIKNKDNPNPPNKVMVFDFKKLIMMKPDIEKLDQFKKNYLAKNEKRNLNDSMDAIGRRYSQIGVRTYRDYIKLNLSHYKGENGHDHKQDSEHVEDQPQKAKKPPVYNNSFSMMLSKKSAQKARKSFSPIKTNGFGENKNYDLELIEKNPENRDNLTQKRQFRNITALRQQKRRYA